MLEPRGTDVTESNEIPIHDHERGIEREIGGRGERSEEERIKDEKKSTRVGCNRSTLCIIRKRPFRSPRDHQSTPDPLFDLSKYDEHYATSITNRR